MIALQTRPAKTADAIDQTFPGNEHVAIVARQPVLKQFRARDGSDGTAFLKRLADRIVRQGRAPPESLPAAARAGVATGLLPQGFEKPV